MISTEKPGSPADLVHFGTKGMKWGVRKAETGGSKPAKADKGPFWTPERKHTAKKVAIGAGILVAVAGAAFVGYKMQQNGKLPISSLKKTPPTPAVKKIIEEPTSIIQVGTSKNHGYSFLEKGGTKDPLAPLERAFKGTVEDKNGTIFNKLADGTIGSKFRDPDGLRDHASRPISHELVIPKSMSQDINSHEDVIKKIWPKIKPTFQSFYTSESNEEFFKAKAARDLISKAASSPAEADAASKFAEEFLKKAKG